MTIFLQAVAIVSGLVGTGVVVWYLLGGNSRGGGDRFKKHEDTARNSPRDR
jgi:hypothetical protein